MCCAEVMDGNYRPLDRGGFQGRKLYKFISLFQCKGRIEVEFLEPKLRGRHYLDVSKVDKARKEIQSLMKTFC